MKAVDLKLASERFREAVVLGMFVALTHCGASVQPCNIGSPAAVCVQRAETARAEATAGGFGTLDARTAAGESYDRACRTGDRGACEQALYYWRYLRDIAQGRDVIQSVSAFSGQMEPDQARSIEALGGRSTNEMVENLGRTWQTYVGLAQAEALNHARRSHSIAPFEDLRTSSGDTQIGRAPFGTFALESDRTEDARAFLAAYPYDRNGTSDPAFALSVRVRTHLAALELQPVLAQAESTRDTTGLYAFHQRYPDLVLEEPGVYSLTVSSAVVAECSRYLDLYGPSAREGAAAREPLAPAQHIAAVRSRRAELTLAPIIALPCGNAADLIEQLSRTSRVLGDNPFHERAAARALECAEGQSGQARGAGLSAVMTGFRGTEASRRAEPLEARAAADTAIASGDREAMYQFLATHSGSENPRVIAGVAASLRHCRRCESQQYATFVSRLPDAPQRGDMERAQRHAEAREQREEERERRRADRDAEREERRAAREEGGGSEGCGECRQRMMDRCCNGVDCENDAEAIGRCGRYASMNCGCQ